MTQKLSILAQARREAVRGNAEPVAWMYNRTNGSVGLYSEQQPEWWWKYDATETPLYAHPPRFGRLRAWLPVHPVLPCVREAAQGVPPMKPEIVEQVGAAFDRVKDGPDMRPGGMIDLIALRNLIPDLLLYVEKLERERDEWVEVERLRVGKQP